MQLARCEFAAVRGLGLSARSGQPRTFLATTASCAEKKPATAKRCAASRRDDAEFGCSEDGGRQVDDGMAVLRRRIDEVRAAESGSWEAPAEWAVREEDEWWWYGTTDGDAELCRLVGALQALLLSERPGVGVGLVAALALAVPASAFVLVAHLLHASRGVLSNLPH